MGQYHYTVNLDKREFLNPRKLGAGRKLWEQLANDPGPGKALIVLLAHPAQRGVGDFDVDENWHGPARVDMSKVGDMPEEYSAIAKRTIGRWRGDRVALIGDYAEDGDIELPGEYPPISMIYGLCCEEGETPEATSPEAQAVISRFGVFKDVTSDVRRVIEHELNGAFIGDGWCSWVVVGQDVWRWEKPVSSGESVKTKGKVTEITETDIAVEWPSYKKKVTQRYPRNVRPDFF